MDDVRDFLRVRVSGSALEVQVGEVSWNSQTPEVDWMTLVFLPAETGEEEIEVVKERLLADEQYFGTCLECGERNVRGHMDEDICHSCMERNHGVVF